MKSLYFHLSPQRQSFPALFFFHGKQTRWWSTAGQGGRSKMVPPTWRVDVTRSKSTGSMKQMAPQNSDPLKETFVSFLEFFSYQLCVHRNIIGPRNLETPKKRHLFENDMSKTSTLASFSYCAVFSFQHSSFMSMLLAMFPVFSVFSWQRYSATCKPGVVTEAAINQDPCVLLKVFCYNITTKLFVLACWFYMDEDNF